MKLCNYIINLCGKQFISNNVHSLLTLRLPMFVRIHRPLDDFNCFKYVFFTIYKKSIKCAKYPFQEMYNRLIEIQRVFMSNPLKLFNYIMIVIEMENTKTEFHIIILTKA